MKRTPAIHHKKDGLLLIRSDSSTRFLTLLETVKYRLFGVMPKDGK